MRYYSLLDKLTCQFDNFLSTEQPETYPAIATSDDLTETDRITSQQLMRVNHAGEVSAQAMYHAQACCARSAQQRKHLLDAATEETKHLKWCARRLYELDGRASYLVPIWYLGAFIIASVAGMAGDKWSLGFIAETESQVSQHLNQHLAKLPDADIRSRQIIEIMRKEEEEHQRNALQAGGISLPVKIRTLMRYTAKIMTSTARWI